MFAPILPSPTIPSCIDLPFPDVVMPLLFLGLPLTPLALIRLIAEIKFVLPHDRGSGHLIVRNRHSRKCSCIRIDAPDQVKVTSRKSFFDALRTLSSRLGRHRDFRGCGKTLRETEF